MSRKISDSTVRRLSHYLRILEAMSADRADTVSSEELARRSGTTAAQVRKDLSLFGSFGKRGLGYGVGPLMKELRAILGLDRTWRVALVGAGRIGSALFEYGGFRDRGYRIVAILDNDPDKIGSRWGDVRIRPDAELVEVVRETGVDIVILAVPGGAVQAVVDRAVAAGVRAILNFAPAQARVPDDVTLKDVNMVMELEALSFALTQDAGAE